MLWVFSDDPFFPQTTKYYILPLELGKLARRLLLDWNTLHVSVENVMSVMSSKSTPSRSGYNLDFLLSLPRLSDEL